MINSVKDFTIGQPRLKKIHGYTKIELTDAKTGRKQITEDENTFQTSVLSDYMRSLGVFNNNPFTSSEWRSNFWQNLVGGIFCFENTITEGTKYMPAGNVMRANGSYGVANSATPVELGSYNSIESSVGNTSITQVYDWTTSQGNGTIGCVCLTSQTGGYIGYGNPSGSVTSTGYQLNRNQNSNTVSLNGLALVEDCTYSFAKSGQTLTVTKTNLAVENASIFNGMSKTLTFTLSNTYLGNNVINSSYRIPVDNGKIYLFPFESDYPYGTYASGATVYYIVYDTATDTVSEKSFVNNTGNSIRFHDVYAVCGDYVICGGVGGYGWTISPFYIINMTDGTYIGSITAPESNLGEFGKLTPDLVVYQNMIINPSDATYRYCNLTSNNTYNPLYLDDIDAMIIGSSYLYKNPLYLATINNLDTAVTKDNTQTMKITYTLTEA